MRLTFVFILLLGLGLAGAGVFILSKTLGNNADEVAQLRAMVARQVPLGPVIVTTSLLRYGQPLEREDVRVVEWPRDARPENAFTDLDELFGPDDAGTRAVLRLIEPGEPLLRSKVTAPGEDAGVSTRLAKGMRAYTITVDVATGVSGFLNPGDRVDIFWSGSADGKRLTRMILQNIRLIAIDQSTEEDRNQPMVARTVTLEARPRTVAKLAQAQSTGQLSLSLRGAGDDEATQPVEIDQSSLVGLPPPTQATTTPITTAPPSRPCVIRVRRGAEVIETPCPTVH